MDVFEPFPFWPDQEIEMGATLKCCRIRIERMFAADEGFAETEREGIGNIETRFLLNLR